MDINFEKDNYEFNARSSAIIYNKDKIKRLLFKEAREIYDILKGIQDN